MKSKLLSSVLVSSLIVAGSASAVAPVSAAAQSVYKASQNTAVAPISSLLASSNIAAKITPSDKKTLRVVTLGDSIAAGYEHGFTLDSISYGIAEHIYEQALLQGYRTEQINYGMLGLTTPGLHNWLQAAIEGAVPTAAQIQPVISDPRADLLLKQTAKLKQDIAAADVILLSIGGNDIKMLIENNDPVQKTVSIADQMEPLIKNYAGNLKPVLEALLELQPQATLVVANQYLPIPKPTIINGKSFSLFLNNPSDWDLLNKGVTSLHEQLQGLAQEFNQQGFDIRIADAAGVITGKEQQLTGILNEDLHPTRAGYAAIGAAYAKTLWEETIDAPVWLTEGKNADKPWPIHVVVNGKVMDSPYPPLLIKGTTYISLRDVTELTGAKIRWENKTSTAHITQGDHSVSIQTGSEYMTINGVKTKLTGVPAFLHTVNKESKLYVPLAALTQGLDYQVVYRSTLRAAIINQ